MLFYEYFRTLVATRITIVLKNGVAMAGRLVAIDPFLNITLAETSLVEGDRALGCISSCSIRGSAVKLIRFQRGAESDQILTDATRLRCCLGK